MEELEENPQYSAPSLGNSNKHSWPRQSGIGSIRSFSFMLISFFFANPDLTQQSEFTFCSIDQTKRYWELVTRQYLWTGQEPRIPGIEPSTWNSRLIRQTGYWHSHWSPT